MLFVKTHFVCVNKFMQMESTFNVFFFSFFDKITKLISNSMHEIDNLCNDSFVVEVVQHLDMCKKRYM